MSGKRDAPDRLIALAAGLSDDADVRIPLSAMPAGLIVLWRGDKAPDGWQLCDGSQGTPDLSPAVPRGPGFRLVYIRKA